MNGMRRFSKHHLYRPARLGVAVALPVLFLVMLLVWGAITSERLLAQPDSPVRTGNPAQQTVSIEFPYVGADPAGALSAAADFESLLSLQTGLEIQVSTYPCEERVIAHLGAGQTDVAPLSPVGYVLGRDEHAIEAKLVVRRFGSFNYRGQIIVQASAGYTDIWSLQGETFAAPDPNSMSGYLVPYILISRTTGLTPTQFFSDVVFAGDHNAAVVAVYNGTVDCGASYEGARAAVVGVYSDVYSVVSVLTYTDYVPQQPWTFRAGLDPTVVQTLTDGIIAVAGTSEGDTALDILLDYDQQGITNTLDSAYDVFRQAFAVGELLREQCGIVYLPAVLRE